MPLPMVHLAVAVQAHALTGRALAPEFLLGCLAPDAIHMRAGSQLEDKVRVHLRVSELSTAETLERIRRFIGQERAQDAFIEGYAAHLLTDHWWRMEVILPFAEKLPPGTTREARRTVYYRETDQVDFNLYHQSPWRQEVWELLATASAPEFAPYLTADEIHRWRLRSLDWFEKLMQEPGIVPERITQDMVEEFIKASAEKISAFLFPRG